MNNRKTCVLCLITISGRLDGGEKFWKMQWVRNIQDIKIKCRTVTWNYLRAAREKTDYCIFRLTADFSIVKNQKEKSLNVLRDNNDELKIFNKSISQEQRQNKLTAS